MAQLKSTAITGNLAVTGTVIANEIKKIDGTDAQLLRADGGVIEIDKFQPASTDLTAISSLGSNGTSFVKVVVSQDGQTKTWEIDQTQYINQDDEGNLEVKSAENADNASKLGNQEPSYYLNYDHLDNKPSIPNPTDYYWANIKVAAESNTETEPQFKTITANTILNNEGKIVNLPPYSADNNNQFLRVINGEVAWSIVPNAEDNTF